MSKLKIIVCLSILCFVLIVSRSCKGKELQNQAQVSCKCPLLTNDYLLLLGGIDQTYLESNSSEAEITGGSKLEIKGGIESNNDKAIKFGGEVVVPLSIFGKKRFYKKININSKEIKDSTYKSYVQWYCSSYNALIDKSDCDGAKKGSEENYKTFEATNIAFIDKIFGPQVQNNTNTQREITPTHPKNADRLIPPQETNKPEQNRILEDTYKEVTVETPILVKEIREIIFTPEKGVKIINRGQQLLELLIQSKGEVGLTIISTSGEHFSTIIGEMENTITSTSFKKTNK